MLHAQSDASTPLETSNPGHTPAPPPDDSTLDRWLDAGRRLRDCNPRYFAELAFIAGKLLYAAPGQYPPGAEILCVLPTVGNHDGLANRLIGAARLAANDEADGLVIVRAIAAEGDPSRHPSARRAYVVAAVDRIHAEDPDMLENLVDELLRETSDRRFPHAFERAIARAFALYAPDDDKTTSDGSTLTIVLEHTLTIEAAMTQTRLEMADGVEITATEPAQAHQEAA